MHLKKENRASATLLALGMAIVLVAASPLFGGLSFEEMIRYPRGFILVVGAGMFLAGLFSWRD